MEYGMKISNMEIQSPILSNLFFMLNWFCQFCWLFFFCVSIGTSGYPWRSDTMCLCPGCPCRVRPCLVYAQSCTQFMPSLVCACARAQSRLCLSPCLVRVCPGCPCPVHPCPVRSCHARAYAQSALISKSVWLKSWIVFGPSSLGSGFQDLDRQMDRWTDGQVN